MSTYIPADGTFQLNETAFTFYTGCTCKFVGPALLMITMDPFKHFTDKDLRSIVNYIIAEGILTEEHKAWLTKNKKKIQFFVTDSDHQKMELDWKTGVYKVMYQ